MPVAAIGAIGSIAGGLFSGLGAKSGADAQAQAAEQAAQLQAQEQANSLAFQKQEFNTQQQNQAPWLKAGQTAVQHLTSLASGGLPAWNQTFQAPTLQQAEMNPGYQFEEQQGQQALENSAAARGGLLSGNTGEALQQFGQNLASTNYQQVYNNALQQYQQAYNIYQQNQANQFNRQASIAGLGQTSAAELGQAGTAAGNTVAGINSTAGSQIGGNINNAGAATASGYVGLGNAVGGGIAGAGNQLSQYLTLQQLLNQNGGGATVSAPNPNGVFDESAADAGKLG